MSDRYTARDCEAACIRLARAMDCAYWPKAKRDREMAQRINVRTVNLMDEGRDVPAIGIDSFQGYKVCEILPGSTAEGDPFGATRYGAREFCDAVRMATGAIDLMARRAK